MKEYLTTWIWVVFILWCILRTFKICKYINIYYLSIILLYGYILFIFVDMNLKGEKYDLQVYLINGIIHAIPLFVLCFSKNLNLKYAFETTIVLIIIYIMFLTRRDTDVVTVYTDDRKRIRNIDYFTGKN